jgi:hypothetical protein
MDRVRDFDVVICGGGLAARRSQGQALEIARNNLDRFEELAQVLFWQAVEECYPDNIALQTRPWVNAWRIRLAPEKWTEEGLFKPLTAQHPFRQMKDNLTGIFAPQSLREFLIYEFPYQILHWGKGFTYYHIVPLIHRLIFKDKPAMWARRWMVRDYPSEP